MSSEEQPKPASKTAQGLFVACQLLVLGVVSAIAYFVDRMPFRVIIPGFALTVLILFVIHRWQRRSGILK
jgi:hypothetical protein